MNSFKLVYACLALLTASNASQAATYHIRTDGGNHVQCTGLANAPYSGSGTGQACAWKGPLVALPPGGNARFNGGDTLQIHSGEYSVGFGAPGAENCNINWPWDCYPAAIPSGTVSNPTRVRGDGYNGLCTSPQVTLTGVERVSRVFNLQGSNNAEISCLEITDNSNCVLAHTGGLACKRDVYPYGSYADDGIYASDSKNIKLSKINVHGLAHYGIYAGRLTDWVLDNVTIRANGWAGWNGDFGKDAAGNQIFSGNSGSLEFTNFLVEYNGCGEVPATGDPVGCWAQDAGGYGDGMGTSETGGDWIFTDSSFRYNTSDGLDLLYHKLGGKIILNRVRTTGNVGKQIKTAGNASITNAVIHANCGYFYGKPFSYFVNDCRAGGDALALIVGPAIRLQPA